MANRVQITQFRHLYVPVINCMNILNMRSILLPQHIRTCHTKYIYNKQSKSHMFNVDALPIVHRHVLYC